MIRLPSQHQRDVSLCDVVQQWEQLVSNSVTAVHRIIVGWIVDRHEPKVVAQRFGVAASEPTDRATGGVETREPIEASASDHVEQNGLREVVGGVPGQ